MVQVNATEERQRLVLVRNAWDEAVWNADVCSWCTERLTGERLGTGACSQRCAVLFQAECEGRNTCCQICEADFTVSQVQRNASTCTPRCRKAKHKERNT